MEKIENGKFDISILGKGSNKAMIFNKPLNVEEPVQFAQPQESKIARYMVVSPQFGLGKIDFVKATQPIEGGEWEESNVVAPDREGLFKDLLTKYKDDDSGYTKLGVYANDGGEFILHIGGEGFEIDPDISIEVFANVKELNKINLNSSELSSQILTARIATVSEASSLI